jgi:P27 family predicted phage terminase small subunit
MGRRGPLPKPTAAKKFEGNPGKRKLPENEAEPRIDDQCPPPPDHLPAVGQMAWKAIAKELHAIGLLTSVDYHALEQYCTAYGFWRFNLAELHAKIDAQGTMVSTVRDPETNAIRYEAPMPEASLMLKFGAELNRWSKVLGLGPAYRVALTTGHGDEPVDDPLGKALENG